MIKAIVIAFIVGCFVWTIIMLFIEVPLGTSIFLGLIVVFGLYIWASMETENYREEKQRERDEKRALKEAKNPPKPRTRKALLKGSDTYLREQKGLKILEKHWSKHERDINRMFQNTSSKERPEFECVCFSCISPEKYGIGRCLYCQHLNGDSAYPDLSDLDMKLAGTFRSFFYYIRENHFAICDVDLCSKNWQTIDMKLFDLANNEQILWHLNLHYMSGGFGKHYTDQERAKWFCGYLASFNEKKDKQMLDKALTNPTVRLLLIDDELRKYITGQLREDHFKEK